MRPFFSFDTLGHGSVWRCSIKMRIGNAINLSFCRYLEQQMSVNKLCNMLSTLFSSSFSLYQKLYQQVQLSRSQFSEMTEKVAFAGTSTSLAEWRKYVHQMKSKNTNDKMHYSKMIMDVSLEGVD